VDTEGAAFELKRSQRAAYPLALIPFLDFISNMYHTKVRRYWDENAENWNRLAKTDYNFYRDYLNMPAFIAILPEVKGLSGLDIGCGEGHKPGC